MLLSKYVWIIYIHIWCLFLLFCVSNRQWYPGTAVKPLHRWHLGDGPVEHATTQTPTDLRCSDYPTKSKTYSCHSAQTTFPQTRKRQELRSETRATTAVLLQEESEFNEMLHLNTGLGEIVKT